LGTWYEGDVSDLLLCSRSVVAAIPSCKHEHRKIRTGGLEELEELEEEEEELTNCSLHG